MLADIGQYIADLADNWAAFMTGGIAAALVLVIERLRRDQLPVRTFIVFLVFGFIAASFMTWRHEHAARILAEQIGPKARNPATVKQLQEYYAEAVSFYLQANSAKSDDEFKDTEKEATEWAVGMGKWIISNMGNGAYTRMLQPPQPPPVITNVKQDRVQLLFMISLIRENLAKFVESPAWDKP
jgi:hypothetical protein